MYRNKGYDPALEEECGFLFRWTLIHQFDLDIAGDKRHFAEALREGVKSVIHIPLKYLTVKFESGCGAGLFGGRFADHFDRFLRNTALVALEILMTITVNMHFTPL